MTYRIEPGDGVDYVTLSFGRLAVEAGLYAARSVAADAWRDAVVEAHQAAWERGEDGFVFTAEMAEACGIC